MSILPQIRIPTFNAKTRSHWTFKLLNT